MIFTNTMYNYGGGYDNVSGTFTAPVDGTYLFTTNICSLDNNYICFAIVVENTLVSSSVGYSAGGSPCFSLEAIVLLQTGNKVWIQTTYSSNGVLQDNLRFNTFSGVFLNK